MELKLGTKGLLSHRVAERDLATRWANDVPVLATPILLWLAELASIRAIGDCIDPSFMTVGFSHDVRHLAPTPLGWIVQIEAEVILIEDKIISFSIIGSDGVDVIFSGVHKRGLVDKSRFLARVQSKTDDYKMRAI